MVDEVRRETWAVSTALAEDIATNGWTVTPVICVYWVDLTWFRSEVQGVRIMSGKELVKRLRETDGGLSPADVHHLADLADASLRPALVAPPSPPGR